MFPNLTSVRTILGLRLGDNSVVIHDLRHTSDDTHKLNKLGVLFGYFIYDNNKGKMSSVLTLPLSNLVNGFQCIDYLQPIYNLDPKMGLSK